MGASLYPPLDSGDLKGVVVQGDGDMSKSNGSILSKVLEAQVKRRCQLGKQSVVISRKIGGHVRSKKPRRVLMKRRRAVPEGSRRPKNGIEKRVKTLKKLIPNSESTGLDGLFRETADYILSLQMRVKLMQLMVKVLTGSNE